MSLLLPNAAENVRLGEVAEFGRGITFKPQNVVAHEVLDSVAVMRTKNVQEELDTTDLWYVPASLVKRPQQFLAEGDILISTANSWNLVGKCCWIPELPSRSSFGGFVSVLRSNPALVDARYLYHWFSSPKTQALLRSFGQKTTNISNLNIGRAEQMRLPLPGLREQRRIAAMLDEADAIRAKRRAALTLLDGLPEAFFLEMFGDPVTNPNRWPNTTTLGEVSHLVSGITKGRKINGKSVREVPYLAVVNVQDRHLSLQTVKTIEATDDEIDRYRLRPGDLLLTEGGDPDKLGRGTLWNAELPEAIHQNHVFRVRVTSPALTPLYLSWLIGSTYGKRYFLRQAKQTTGIATINMGQLKAFPLILPPLALQHQFGARVEATNCAKAAHQTALANLDDLFSSIQTQVFGGTG